MTLSRSDIEQRAQQVLWNAGAITAPVDIVKVVASLGASLHEQQFEDHVSGVLAIQGGAKHILINKNHHSNRKRFTAAHECGHLVLHHVQGDGLFIDKQMQLYKRVGVPSGPEYTSQDSTTTPTQEREANLFASAVLMPAPLLTQAIQRLNHDLDEDDMLTLANAFGVSSAAMSIRLQNLGLLSVKPLDEF